MSSSKLLHRKAELNEEQMQTLINQNSPNTSAVGWIVEDAIEQQRKQVQICRLPIKEFYILSSIEENDDSKKDLIELHRNNMNRRIVRVFQLSKDPLIHEYDDFLSTMECKTLLDLAEECGWQPSKTSIGRAYGEQSAYASTNSGSRTSWSSRLCSKIDHPLIQIVEARVSRFLNVPIEKLEPMSVLRYLPGQQFKIHHDGYFRSFTFMIYLSDVVEGGETEFPNLGVALKPKTGRAICWTNILSNGKADMRLLHAGLPVVKGIKYAVPIFVNINDVRFAEAPESIHN